MENPGRGGGALVIEVQEFTSNGIISMNGDAAIVDDSADIIEYFTEEGGGSGGSVS